MASGAALVLGKKDQVSNHEMSVTRVDAFKQKGTNVLWLFATDKDSSCLRVDATGAGAGVIAYCPSTGIGVRAYSDYGTGVYGEATRGGVAGVHGVGTPDRDGEGGEATVGVMGDGTYAGVWGFSDGHGVEGSGSGAGTGVFGNSQTGTGIMGESGKSGHAGAFFGHVMVVGDFDVQGAKAAAVPFPDGTLRRLYSIESPESWFEDFGEARLVNGKAEVKIDPRFAAVVKGPYRVFITPCGDSNGLYVSSRTRRSFGVREQQRGKSTVVFNYRVVAKRKDIPGRRFVTVTPPRRTKARRRPALPNQGFAPRPR